jgi:hypothetical protein
VRCGCSGATLVLVASISSCACTEIKDSTAPASTRKQLKREEQTWCSQRSNISAVEEVMAHRKKGAADDRGSVLMLQPGSAWRRQSRQRVEGQRAGQRADMVARKRVVAAAGQLVGGRGGAVVRSRGAMAAAPGGSDCWVPIKLARKKAAESCARGGVEVLRELGSYGRTAG